ncbi:MAG: sigma-70 family RNA polymerase sigma factor [Chloroflexota bacterium]|jgi:RNA polymerase sigma-70 factor (ECF subfamily)|nr:sigma-70 family RNA polymerase sigma factor [Chloroflexota bacterium]MDH5243342.1 sigma-70 family RNA polymerase sigma factor [Chloroflexota bacterium]
MSRALVERAQQGDRDAYELLARGSSRRLFAVAQRILRDVDQAEDAVQQTLVDIWRDLPSLRDPDRYDAWTYRIVVRHCRGETRRHRRIGGSVVDLSEDMASPDDPIGDVAVRDQLDRAFRSLRHEHRVVVVLHHFVGLPLGEIADILDIPYGTVGSRLHHAMRSMRATIDAAERTTVRGGQPA